MLPAITRTLQYFAFDHLPEGPLRDTSAMFATLAYTVAAAAPDNGETVHCLRKLLEAKDCGVRARLPQPTAPTPAHPATAIGKASVPSSPTRTALTPNPQQPPDVRGPDEKLPTRGNKPRIEDGEQDVTQDPNDIPPISADSTAQPFDWTAA